MSEGIKGMQVAKAFVVISSGLYLIATSLIIGRVVDSNFSSLPLSDYLQRIGVIVGIATIFLVQAAIIAFLSWDN